MHRPTLKGSRWALCSVLLTLLTLPTACGDDEEKPACSPGTATGCEAGQVCEEVAGGEPACFAPLTVAGRVFDIADEAGLVGATVVAVDANGAARSDNVESAVDGSFRLLVPAPRDAEGGVTGDPIQLRVAASGYQAFPSPPRTALPIDLDSAQDVEGVPTLMNAATDVGLSALPAGADQGGEIRGSIAAEQPGGALVTVVVDGTAVASAIADQSGTFTLFNVPEGEVMVQAHLAGIVIEPADVTVGAEAVTGLVLSAVPDGVTAMVSGSVNIVNAPGGALTSVILVLESTFVENAARGLVPAGLRAAGVSSAFEIPGVPPGRYVVLAAFENDDLVRDPDQTIGGTQIVRIEVPQGSEAVSLPESFKVTEALAVVSPGAEELEQVPSGQPVTFTWADDSSEDGYELRVFDAFGRMLFEDTSVPRGSGSADIQYSWDGAGAAPGQIYQFRVLSFRDKQGRTSISATEDLRGVFQYGTAASEEMQ